MDKTVEELQNEIKVLKNEIKETLTDIREYLLTNVENPFPVESTHLGLPRQGMRKSPAMPAYKVPAGDSEQQAISEEQEVAEAAPPGIAATHISPASSAASTAAGKEKMPEEEMPRVVKLSRQESAPEARPVTRRQEDSDTMDKKPMLKKVIEPTDVVQVSPAARASVAANPTAVEEGMPRVVKFSRPESIGEARAVTRRAEDSDTVDKRPMSNKVIEPTDVLEEVSPAANPTAVEEEMPRVVKLSRQESAPEARPVTRIQEDSDTMDRRPMPNQVMDPADVLEEVSPAASAFADTNPTPTAAEVEEEMPQVVKLSRQEFTEAHPVAEERRRDDAMDRRPMPKITRGNNHEAVTEACPATVEAGDTEWVRLLAQVYENIGGLTRQLKEAILQLVGLDGSSGPMSQVSLGECLRVLADLDKLLWRSRLNRR